MSRMRTARSRRAGDGRRGPPAGAFRLPRATGRAGLRTCRVRVAGTARFYRDPLTQRRLRQLGKERCLGRGRSEAPEPDEHRADRGRGLEERLRQLARPQRDRLLVAPRGAEALASPELVAGTPDLDREEAGPQVVRTK